MIKICLPDFLNFGNHNSNPIENAIKPIAILDNILKVSDVCSLTKPITGPQMIPANK